MKRFFALLLALAVLMALPVTASANAAEPPAVVVLVENPPEDLTLRLVNGVGEEARCYDNGGWRHAWEGYYSFYHANGFDLATLDLADGNTADLLLEVSAGGETRLLPLPDKSTPERYRNYYTLDLGRGVVRAGLPGWRRPLLVAIRVGSTLLIEGLIFFLFGYRQKRSWLIFVIANLITQAFVNAVLLQFEVGQYPYGFTWLLYWFVELVVFIAEAIVFARLLREKSQGRGALCAFVANAASLILGGLLITQLPV